MQNAPDVERSERRGMTLLLVVVLLTAFLSISAGIFQIAFTEYRLSGELSDSFRALYAADEGLERIFFYDRVLDSALGCTGTSVCTGTPQTVNLGNGACMELQLVRIGGGQTTATGTGEFRCGASPVAVRRALEATYQKESNSTAPPPIVFWSFDWGTGESAATQNVEDVVTDNRGAVEPNDGNRGTTALAETTDPAWINPNGGNCGIGGNCALLFDGVVDKDLVTVPDNSALNPAQITIAAWVSIPVAPASVGQIVSKGANSGYRYRINNNRTIRFFDRGATNFTTSVGTIPLNTWTYVAVSGDASGLKIYINGVLDPSVCSGACGAYGGPTTALPLYIGAEPAFPAEYFNGCIDSVKIWNTALPASDVLADYNSYTPGTKCLSPVGFWKFDEAAGLVAADSSGGGNPGTVSGTTVVAGMMGNARNFTASTDRIFTASNSLLNTDTHTIAFWFRVNQAPSGAWSQVMAYRPVGTDRSPGIWLHPTTNCLHWRYDPGNGAGMNCGGPTGEGTAFTIGTWYHVAGVKSGATYTYFINGNLVTTTVPPNPKTSGSAAIEFGQTTFPSGIFTIDEVRIYDAALNEGNIRTIMNQP